MPLANEVLSGLNSANQIEETSIEDIEKETGLLFGIIIKGILDELYVLVDKSKQVPYTVKDLKKIEKDLIKELVKRIENTYEANPKIRKDFNSSKANLEADKWLKHWLSGVVVDKLGRDILRALPKSFTLGRK